MLLVQMQQVSHAVNSRGYWLARLCVRIQEYVSEFRNTGMESSGQLGAKKGETSKGAVATGETAYTDGQLAAIGAVVQGLLEKTYSKGQPHSGVGSCPSRGSDKGESGVQRELGSMPSSEALCGLGLGRSDASQQQPPEDQKNPFASLIPWLTAFSSSGTQQEKAESKPARCLVAKGLPTLPTKLAEKVWNLEYVEMEEFLPKPRTLRIAEQGNPSCSLQDSLVGALNQ